MILICLEEDQQTISRRFRKTDYFAFLEDKNIVIKQNPHKLSKSNEFFEYFKTLGIERIYLKALGYKTFLRLEKMGIRVFFISKAEVYTEIKVDELLEIRADNAEGFCTLGHF
jgi:predicted Fe-Mo cluster-binding NifX family protein